MFFFFSSSSMCLIVTNQDELPTQSPVTLMVFPACHSDLKLPSWVIRFSMSFVVDDCARFIEAITLYRPCSALTYLCSLQQ